MYMFRAEINEPRHEKACLRGFRPGPIQTTEDAAHQVVLDEFYYNRTHHRSYGMEHKYVFLKRPVVYIKPFHGGTSVAGLFVDCYN